MEKDSVYIERFPFRQRTFRLEDLGIRMTEKSLFYSKDVFYHFEDVGPYLQYSYESVLLNLFISIIFVVLGANLLRTTGTDNFVFIVAVSLVSGGIYWLIRFVIDVKYKGAFYFSHTTVREKQGFEIKSNYPASIGLEAFFNDFIAQKYQFERERLIHSVSARMNWIHIENSAKKLIEQYKRNSDEIEELILKMKQRRKELRRMELQQQEEEE